MDKSTMLMIQDRVMFLGRKWTLLVDLEGVCQDVLLECWLKDSIPSNKHIYFRLVDAVRRVRNDRASCRKNLSIMSLYGDGTRLRRDLPLAKDNGLSQVDRKDEVDFFMSLLEPREREVLWRIYWKGDSYEEISKVMDVSVASVGNVRHVAIEKIRHFIWKDILR